MEFNKKQFWKWTKKWIPRTLLGYLTITFIWVLVYKWVNPPGTLLMLIKQVESGKGHIYYQWVDDDQISPFIKACSMASEDQNFPDHFGLDIMAIQKAIDFNQKHKRTRGASTITQQVAKNVFLWPGRSIVRKVFELQFTFYIELLWS
ncbi:MAG: transglycosylase domain-containing protein, partial [Saprospiraceae bacterium]|nr:transglycosylase domain-containing protein [Saprospiraceae bacterium]